MLYSLIFQKLKKMALFLVLFVLCLSLLACSAKDTCEVIDKEDPKLSVSMRHFYDDPATSYKESAHFMAKIVSLDKVPISDEVMGEAYAYEMVVVIAPRCDEKLKLESFTFDLSEKAKEYYSNFPHLASYSIFGLEIYGSTDLPWINTSEDAKAYRFNLTFDNAGNKNQSDYGLSDEDFDDMIREVNIVVDSSKGKEEIKINYLDELNFYQSEAEIPESRSDLKALINGTDKGFIVASLYDELIEH